MQIKYEIIPVSEDIQLTEIRSADIPAIIKYLNEPVFSRNTCTIPYPYKKKDGQEFIRLVRSFEETNLFQKDWAIRDVEDMMIGAIGILYDHGIKSHRSQIGYWLGKPFWNQGIISNVIEVFTKYIFEHRDLVRLEGHVFGYNPSSCRALEKAGFRQEGFLEWAQYKDGAYLDIYIYAKVNRSTSALAY
jgi:ribosomal-protein-alanine N-acetyltransferase